MAKILCVVAHADDETLGCGGTLARHVQQGDHVSVIVMTNGVDARQHLTQNLSQSLQDRLRSAEAAMKILGIQEKKFLDFPDNGMDQIPLLEIVQTLEAFVTSIKPSRIYTHHGGDLNIDHRITHQAVLTACRPLPESTVNSLLSFEVQSSTEWQSPSFSQPFHPNYFINITAFLSRKLQALSCYEAELRDYPHSRSLKSVESLAQIRGSSMGVAAAEAFMLERWVEK